MINRELIRIKLVQVMYSYLQKGIYKPHVAEKELLLSLDKAYDLYNYLLLLLVEVGRMSVRMLEMRQSRSKKLNDGVKWSRKFADNRFILQLESNRQLRAYCEEQSLSWADQEEFVRSLYNKVEQSDFYREYMASETSTYEEDREVWRLIYRNLICNNDELASILEDINVYWNDDKFIIDTFVLKTINRFRTHQRQHSQVGNEPHRPDGPHHPAVRTGRDNLFPDYSSERQHQRIRRDSQDVQHPEERKVHQRHTRRHSQEAHRRRQAGEGKSSTSHFRRRNLIIKSSNP